MRSVLCFTLGDVDSRQSVRSNVITIWSPPESESLGAGYHEGIWRVGLCDMESLWS